MHKYRNIPNKYKFDYVRTKQRIDEIRNKLKGFEPVSNEEMEWLKITLKEYHTMFCHIKEIDKKIKIKGII
jgi:hypothetical protein